MKNSFTLIAFICALLLHLIVGGALLMNVDFSLPKEKPREAIINASVVNQKLFDDLAQRKSDKLLAEKQKKEQARKEKERIKREKLRAEKKRKEKEAQRIKAEKAEKKRKKQAAEKLKAQKEAEKAKKIADDKRKKQQAERKKKEAQRLQAEKVAKEKALAKEKAARQKAEKAAKEKAQKEAQIKAAEEAKRKAEAEKERLRQSELEKLMDAEFEESFSSAQSSKQLSEIARYKALIQDKISRNWQVEPNMKGKTCTLAIKLAPDGLVLEANASSGDTKLCESAKRAAFKAKTLPIPKDVQIATQFRDFDITLDPDL